MLGILDVTCAGAGLRSTPMATCVLVMAQPPDYQSALSRYLPNLFENARIPIGDASLCLLI
jgi:hypothetical protein